MNAHKLKKNEFDAIRKELLSTNRTQADIAADYQVSSSMVSHINNVRSWGNYLNGTKAKQPLRVRVRPETPTTPTKVERAAAAGLNPVSHAERTESRAEKEFSEKLKQLDDAPNRAEYDEDKRITAERLDGLLRILKHADRRFAHQGNFNVVLVLLLLVVAIIAIVK